MNKNTLRLIAILLLVSTIPLILQIFSIIYDSIYSMDTVLTILLLMGLTIVFLSGMYIYSLTLKVSLRNKIRYISFLLLFFFYMFLLLKLTVFRPRFDLRFNVVNHVIDNNIDIKYFLTEYNNFIPFRTVLGYLNSFKLGYIDTNSLIRNVGGNILAFAPLAFFIPVLFKKLRTFKRFTLFVFFFVLSIEVVQVFFLVGKFDVDDLLLNVLGAILFYQIFHHSFIRRIMRKFMKRRSK